MSEWFKESNWDIVKPRGWVRIRLGDSGEVVEGQISDRHQVMISRAPEAYSLLASLANTLLKHPEWNSPDVDAFLIAYENLMSYIEDQDKASS